MQRHHRPRPFLLGSLAAAMLAGFATLYGTAHAADLGVFKGPPRTAVVLPPSPCAEYRAIYTQALQSARQVARVFRRDDRVFHRLKRRRMNDGFDGPDIRINAGMTREQLEAATLTTRVEIFVAKARQLACAPPASLNRIDNEAARLHREIVQAAFWIDPQTFR